MDEKRENPVKGIRIRIPDPEEKTRYTKTTYIPEPTAPMPAEPTPAKCRDKSTLMIHMCRRAQEGGWEKCQQCKDTCAWGREYMKRMDPHRNWHKPKEKIPKPTVKKVDLPPKGTGQIPWFGPWLKDELKRRNQTQVWLSYQINYNVNTIGMACAGDRWSRTFELLTIKALGMNEQEATQRAAAWAWKQREGK